MGNFLKLAFAIVLIFMPSTVMAGAWTNKEGESTLINNFYMFHFNRFKDANGTLSDRPDFVKFEYKPYYEYGLSDVYSAGFSPSFQHVRGEYVTAFESGLDKNEAFTGVDVFLKRKLFQSKAHSYVISIIPSVELPGIYKEETTPFFGKQESFWSVMGAFGVNTYSIADNYGYLNVEAGVRSRFSDAFTGEGGSSFKAEITTGLPVTRTHSVNVGVTYTKSLAGYSGAGNFLDRYGYDSTQASITDIFFWRGLGLEYGYIYQFDAKNAGIGSGVKISIWHKF